MPASIVPDLLDMLPDTIVVRRRTGVSTDGYRNPTYGDPENVPARISKGTLLVRGGVAQEVTSTVQALLGGVYNFTTADEFTLPARFKPQKPQAIQVLSTSDENGPHHETVFF